MKEVKVLASVCVAIIMAMCVSVQATIVLSDDFEDGVLNSSLWVQSGGIATEAGGKLTLTKGGDYQGNVKSVNTFSIAADETAILSTSNMAVQAYSALGTWGFDQGGFYNSVMVRAQDFGGGNMVNILMAKNGAYQSLAIQPTNLWLYGWTLTWSPERVVVESQVWGTLFDSDVQTTDRAGNPWRIPGPEANMQIWLGSPAYNATYALSLDDVTLEIIPEPATLLLLSLGGLTFIRGKRA